MNLHTLSRALSRCVLLRCLAALCVLVSAGCSGLLPAPAPQAVVYQLDGILLKASPPNRTATVTATEAATTAPTLVVQPPRAAAGFDTRHIVYVREPHKLEHFAHSDWVDTPARMLGPLIVSAIESTGGFRAVGAVASGLSGDMRLDTEVLRLQQDFTTRPSQVRFTLRAALLDGPTRRVIASQEFEAFAPAATDDPYGGVVAANQAVQTVLAQLARFCAERAGTLRPPR